MEADFKERAFKMREALIMFEHPLRNLAHGVPADLTEIHANVMLAFRHLEDLRMRLGKAIQAFDGGTSVYPR